ncbi:MAG: hypothetical protein JSW59_13595 [Phycisphaerales bacterium]|nr:MAG: hypothetical protein JSW59_13595 [Phycisphaerales bacterium]
MSKHIMFVGTVIALLGAMIPTVLADVPQLISFQGILYDNGENPLTGQYNVTFRIYDVETGGTHVWLETISVDCDNGLYNVILGLTNQLNLDFDGQYWLGVQVTGDDELSPRFRLTSVPTAYRAAVADSLAGGGESDSDDDWTGAGTGSMYTTHLDDKVGIGTTSPSSKLHVRRYADGYESAAARIGLQWYLPALPTSINHWFSIEVGGMGIGGLGNNPTLVRESGSELYFQTEETMHSSPSDRTTQMVLDADGNVGIGTTNPGARLSVQMPSGTLGSFKHTGGLLVRSALYNSGNPLEVQDALGYTRVVVNVGGRVGIGTSDPQSGLHLKGGGLAGHADLRLESDDNESWNIGAGEKLWFAYYDGSYHDYLYIDKNTGTVSLRVLEITGGSDLAEPFEVAGAESIEPGMVVAIDPENPGQLRIADKAYDRTVAGIVSGANGIKPGMTMSQEGTVADGSLLVALTGRVYAWADASHGPIEPGDLLTTSDMPGHAMKVMDFSKAHGAILGKAMSSLDQGQGLVLVLVTLQ